MSVSRSYARTTETRKAVDHPTSTTARGYGSDWQRLSLAFRQAYPWCTLCLLQGTKTMAQCVDHIQPHKQQQELRMNWRNLQALCNRCHNVDKSRLDRKGSYHYSQWYELLAEQKNATDEGTLALLPVHVVEGIRKVVIRVKGKQWQR